MGSGSDINDTTDTISLNSHYEIGSQSRGEIYLYQDDIDQATYNTKVRTRQFRTENTTYLDGDQHVKLLSHASIYEYSGTSDTKEFNLREFLEWNHTNRLRSIYEVDWTRNDVQGQTADSVNARASVTHRLFESLVSTGEVYTQYFDGTIGSSNVFGGSFTETYDKNLSESVDMMLSLHGFVERRETSAQSGTAWVANEPHTMKRGQRSQLSHLDVVAESISVRSAVGSRQYFLMSDYIVIQRGHITEIEPTVTGNIPEGQIVAVTYYYVLPPSYAVTATGFETSAGLEFWKMLSLYSRYMNTNEGASGNNPLETQLDPMDRFVVGSSLSWKRLRAMIEYEDLHSKFQPATSLAENLSVEWSPRRGIHTMLSLGHRNSDFSENGGKMEAFNANGTASTQLGRRARLLFEADFRTENWNEKYSNYDLTGYYLRTGYEWRYRDVSAKLTARYSEVDQHGETEQEHRVDFVLRRDF
jgi:hypothetical protein